MVLQFKIKANSKTDAVEKAEGQWVLRIHAPAIDSKANERLIKFLSSVLAIPQLKIRIKKGAKSKLKLLEIDEEETVVIKKLESNLVDRSQ